jgi:hypothetical protein
VNEVNYAATNCATVRGSASAKKISLNAKTERTKLMNVKPMVLEQECTIMNEDARAIADGFPPKVLNCKHKVFHMHKLTAKSNRNQPTIIV